MTQPWSPLSEANESFTADDIATPLDQLLCWEFNGDNTGVIERARASDYTYLPIVEKDTITGVVPTAHAAASKGPLDWDRLTIDHLIAGNTPILRLIELFADNPQTVYFTLSSSEIDGLITSADLNKTAVRAAIFVLLAEFESSMARLIQHVLPSEDAYCQHLTEDRVSKLKAVRDRARTSHLDLDLINYVFITDLVTIIAKDETLRDLLGYPSRKQTEDKMSLTDIRNMVSHPVGPLVNSADDIKVLRHKTDRLIELQASIDQAWHKL